MTKRKLNLRNFIKVIVVAISLTGVTKVAAQSNEQFPAPQDFRMSYHYIGIFSWGSCAGQIINKGPYHCTHFEWKEPNLSETESQLIGYRIYYSFYEEGAVKVITETGSLDFEIGVCIVGYTWVTALYANPNGQSAPSNIEAYLGAPALDVTEKEMKTHSIVYNNQMKTVEVTGLENITSIDIFAIDGRLITTSELNNIDVKHLANGIYIIKITTATGKIISDKLIIN